MKWRVHAVKYADRNARIRADSFLFDENPTAPHAMDYFMWVLQTDSRTILVDSGYDNAEGSRRDRPIRMDPVPALAPLGIRPEEIDTLIVTHLHYDHAGGLHLFPNATLHIQEVEMAYATGPCMCHAAMRHPFTADHICEAIKRLFAGRVVFHDEYGQVAPGVTVHRVGGHSRGLQAVRVETEAGALCLASDAAHFYENAFSGKLFPIVADAEEMLRGFETIQSLAAHRGLMIPGHDPLVRDLFPPHDQADWINRLDLGPVRSLPY